MNHESRSTAEHRAAPLKSIDFVSAEPSSDRRLFASRLVKKRERFRRILRLYATTGVITLTALAFLFD
ncbi:MAG TPA: hypothetical protein VN361_09990 [Oxalicibacterium sp.]|nr:hypothetical protein [Oxalicibacterium sp.]